MDEFRQVVWVRSTQQALGWTEKGSNTDLGQHCAREANSRDGCWRVLGFFRLPLPEKFFTVRSHSRSHLRSHSGMQVQLQLE